MDDGRRKKKDGCSWALGVQSWATGGRRLYFQAKYGDSVIYECVIMSKHIRRCAYKTRRRLVASGGGLSVSGMGLMFDAKEAVYGKVFIQQWPVDAVTGRRNFEVFPFVS